MFSPKYQRRHQATFASDSWNFVFDWSQSEAEDLDQFRSWKKTISRFSQPILLYFVIVFILIGISINFMEFLNLFKNCYIYPVDSRRFEQLEFYERSKGHRM